MQGLILKRNLDSMGYQSFWGKNGKLALDLIREHKPSLVVSDVEMPEMDGYTLCRSIKDDPDLAEIPVLMLTSLSSTSDILFGLRAGADAYVTKPHDPNHLMERIEYMLKH